MSGVARTERGPEYRGQAARGGDKRLHQCGGTQLLDVGVVGRVTGGERVGQVPTAAQREHWIPGVHEMPDVSDGDVAATHQEPRDR